MPVYTVHVPEGVADEVRRADRTVFIREGFSGWALIFGSLFLVWHRLWAALLAWVVAACGLAAIALALHPPSGPLLVLALLMHLFLGVEGNDLRRWRLERHHFRLADVVAGYRRADAERVFFLRRPGRPPSAAPRASLQRSASAAMPAVIGMFQTGDDA